MGFFTIVAWAVLCVFLIGIIIAIVDYHKCKKVNLSQEYLTRLNSIKLRTEFFWAVILSLCWLGWRYFGA